MPDYINDTCKPLIFLGSSSAMYKQTELCESLGIRIHGIIDSDYFGNTEEICGFKVIDGQNIFDNEEKRNYYKSNFNFFCAVNWTPESDKVSVRNRNKRLELINLIDKWDLPCISIVNPTARISRYAKIGHGCFIDGNVMIEHHVVVDNFVNIYSNNDIGHDSYIGRNTVLQRKIGLASKSHLENDVYMGIGVLALKPGARYGTGTFVQEGIYIRRGTLPNEIVSLKTENPSRIVGKYH